MAWHNPGELENEFEKKYGSLFVELKQIEKELKQIEKERKAGLTLITKGKIQVLRQKLKVARDEINKELGFIGSQIEDDLRGGYSGTGHPQHMERAAFLGKKLNEINDIIAQLDAWLAK